MSKITRRSYKRKKIIMGAALFGAVGLVSTGFAAWVLSASTSVQQGANLSVGQVVDKNMTFGTVSIYKTSDANKETDNTFHFEPKSDDLTGRVRYDGENAEMLSLTVASTLTHVQNLGTLTAQLTVNETANFEAAVTTQKYVVAPVSYSETPITLHNAGNDVGEGFTSSVETNPDNGDKTMTFTYEVKFAWGEFFNELNPGEFFDSTAGLAYEQGSVDDTVADNTVSGHLNNLKTLLNGIELTLTLTANPN